MTAEPLSLEQAQALLDFFDPKEVAQLLERSHATHHGGPDTREKFRRDPSTGLYFDAGPSGVVKTGHSFDPLPYWFDEWAERDFYVPDRLDPATFTPTRDTGPVVMMSWQKVLIRYMLDIDRPLDRFYHNIIISTIKKTGKSLLTAAIGRWIAETWGNYSEVICLGHNSSIRMADGSSKKIWDIVARQDTGPVLSLNPSTGRLEPKRIVGWYESPLAGREYVKVMCVEDPRPKAGTWMTHDHPVLTPEGYAPAGELKDGDLIVTSYTEPNEQQMQLIVGTMLGDAGIGSGKKPNQNRCLRMKHCAAQREYLQLKVNALEGLGSNTLQELGNGQFGWSSTASPWFRKLYDVFYPNGVKIVPRDIVERYFSPLMLATWFMDDGMKASSSVMLDTECFGIEDVTWLADLLSSHGIDAHVSTTIRSDTGNERRCIYIEAPWHRANGRNELLLQVGRFIPPSMRYKLPSPAGIAVPEYDESAWSIGYAYPAAYPVRVRRDNSPPRQKVYCLDVEDNHNFIAGGLVVHNCLGADKDQAEDKLYAAITKSIELSPSYDARLQVLFGLTVHPEDPDPDHPTIFAPDYSNPLWRLRSTGATHIPNHGTVKAVPRVYKKLAGGNQTAALFTEMWTFTSTDARRLVDEMTPPPTRPRSIRLFEGYAGFEGVESDLWSELWDQAMNPKLGARMVTREELEPYGGWPFPPAPQAFRDSDYPLHRDSDDPIPLYVNDKLSVAAFIDQGEVARRMPWQTEAYYESQRLDESYDRHHRNVRSAHKAEFVPKHWWDACNVQNHPAYVRRTDRNTGVALPPVHESLRVIPPLLPSEPIVLSCDASVNHDCTALMAVSYAVVWEYLERDPSPSHFTTQYLREHPEQEKKRRRKVDESQVMVRAIHLWEPTPAHPMNYTTQLKPVILRYYSYAPQASDPEDSGDPLFDQYELDPTFPEYNVLEVAYDQFQLHDLMVNLRNEYGLWIKSFSQSVGRDTSDNDLYVSIRDKTVWHDGHQKLDEHCAGAARRVPKSTTSSTVERRHIEKKSNASHVDLMITLSMASFELRRMDHA